MRGSRFEVLEHGQIHESGTDSGNSLAPSSAKHAPITDSEKRTSWKRRSAFAVSMTRTLSNRIKKGVQNIVKLGKSKKKTKGWTSDNSDTSNVGKVLSVPTVQVIDAESSWSASWSVLGPQDAQSSRPAASSGECQSQDQAASLGMGASDIPLGVEVKVTSDALHLERCVKGVGMTWPNGPSGRPWSRKLGMTGRVIEVDYNDLTVELDGGKGWIPIKALLGYEKFTADACESVSSCCSFQPRELPPELAEPKPQESALRSLTVNPPSPRAKEPIQIQSEQDFRKPPEILQSPKFSATPNEKPSCSIGTNPEPAMKKRSDPEVTPEKIGLDQPKRPSKKGRRLSSQSGKSPILYDPTSPTILSESTSATLKSMSSLCSIFSSGESDEEQPMLPSPPRVKTRTSRKVSKVKKRVAPSQQIQSRAVMSQEKSRDHSLNLDLPQRLERSPSLLSGASNLSKASVISKASSRAFDAAISGVESMEGPIQVVASCDVNDWDTSAYEDSVLSDDLNVKGLSQSRLNSSREAPKADNARDREPLQEVQSLEAPRCPAARPPTSMPALECESRERSGSLGSLFSEPLGDLPERDGPERDNEPVLMLSVPQARDLSNQAKQRPARDGRKKVSRRPQEREARCSFWSSPENSDTDVGYMISPGSDLQRLSGFLNAAVDGAPQAEADGQDERLRLSDEVASSNELVAASTAGLVDASGQSTENRPDQLLLPQRQIAGSPNRTQTNSHLTVPNTSTNLTDTGSLMGDSESEMEVFDSSKDQEVTYWRCATADGECIAIRAQPDIKGPMHEMSIDHGVVFRVCQELQGADGVLYLQLADGSGWVFDRKPGVGEMCVRAEARARLVTDNSDLEESRDVLAPLQQHQSVSNRRRSSDGKPEITLTSQSSTHSLPWTTADTADTTDSAPWTMVGTGETNMTTRSSMDWSQTESGRSVSRHINWRSSRVNSICEANLISEALQKVAGKDKAMNPVRAQSGLSLLNRMKNLLERQDFDDTAGIKTIESIFFDSMPRKHVEIQSVEQVLRIDLLKRFLRKVADDFASIEATFHGTQEKYVNAILDVGLNPSLCATGAYGHGAYVGTHAGVAHQYADPNQDGWRYMLVILVIVGSEVVKGSQGAGVESTATKLDSLVNPTQYCFVEEDRLYCSHLITYRVVQTHKKRTGGGWEDPFQRKLASAVTRAAKLRNKRGLR